MPKSHADLNGLRDRADTLDDPGLGHGVLFSMRIAFVGHASILVNAGPVHLLMDPWLRGEVFNESWALHPEPVLSASRRTSGPVSPCSSRTTIQTKS